MWFYPVVAALVILAIAGGGFAGGIFTIVLLPVAAIVLLSGLGYAILVRAAQDPGGTNTRPLAHGEDRETGRVRTSPEGLVDARHAHR